MTAGESMLTSFSNAYNLRLDVKNPNINHKRETSSSDVDAGPDALSEGGGRTRT